ncbi:MAG: AmmeMemoRadiSam system protein B [Candidatus Shapirobacteria bacterium]|nr:AmmeMemoRadiSam system protein B [Candidatus Shapirobacteria bacterium]
MKKNILFLISLDSVLLILIFLFKLYFQPIAIVVPHHNIVKEKRLEFFKTIAQKRPVTKKIIIIGPDHFSPYQNTISYSNFNWNLSNGEIKFNSSLETKLKPFLSLQNSIVKNDHAIYNLLPDIKFVWPNSQVFPILVGQNYPISKLNNLINELKNVCNYDCLLISSVDFSHYLPAAFANVHDQKSIYDLSTQNLTEIPKLEVDSPQSLYVLTKYSILKNAHKWDLFYHSNSGEIANDPDIETTSHVLGFYQRSFFKNKITKVETYLISKNIDSKKSLNSLGKRFFYGTDYIDLNYSSKSSYILPFDLADDMVVTVVVADNKPTFTFFPTEIKNGATYFLRGQEKINKLNYVKFIYGIK